VLKFRIIATLLYDGVALVKGERFQTWRRVGSLIQAVKLFTLRGADELIILDVAATKEGRGPDLEMVKRVAEHCFVPLTVGGGVRSVEDVGALLAAGADRVSIKTAWEVIPECAAQFGGQAIVHSVDCVGWKYDAPFQSSAGELLLGDTDRDGTLSGIEGSVNVFVWRGQPSIISGGFADPDDFEDMYLRGFAGVAAGALWQFTHWTPDLIKRELAQRGVPVRV